MPVVSSWLAALTICVFVRAAILRRFDKQPNAICCVDLPRVGAALFRRFENLLRSLRGVEGRYDGGFHPSFLSCGVCNGSGRIVWAFGAVSVTCRSCKPYWLSGIQIDNRYFQVTPDSLRDDPEIVLAAIDGQGQEGRLMGLRTLGGSTVLETQEDDRAGFRFASDRLKANIDIVHAAIRKQGLALQFVHDTFRDDMAVVLEAVANDGFALQYASERLRDNAEVVSAAADQTHLALQYSSSRLQNWFEGGRTLAINCAASTPDAGNLVSVTFTNMSGDVLSTLQLETSQSIAELRVLLASELNIPSAALRFVRGSVVVSDFAHVGTLSVGVDAV